MKKQISPELPSGFRDYLPKDMIPRQWMLDTIRSVFERFGFLPLDTSGVEREEVLTGGDPNFKMQIFKTFLRDQESGLALRFDLTVPLARVVSLYSSDISRPFKRYQMGKVWRGERPQAGRFCEFMQFDADIVGSNRTSADAEIISLMYETLTALGVGDFVIKVNNRKILNGLAAYVGYSPDKTPDVLRLIDKLDKLGWDNISGELGDTIGLAPSQLEKLKSFLDLRTGSNEETTVAVRELMSVSSEAVEGAKELSEITMFVDALGVPREFWQIDLSVARGLGYYTGTVFETVLLKLPSIGSVFSGGRYDDLVSRFGGDNIPATGASVGVDRLFAALETLELVPKKITTTKIIVLNFDDETEEYCNRVVGLLRKAGIPSELYLGKEKSIKSQLAYALKQEVPVIIIAGSRERDDEVVQVKDTKNRIQKAVPLAQLSEAIKIIID
ncbi:MAG: histidine--tRNA ligase [Candidatus Paceibacterota bacterium]